MEHKIVAMYRIKNEERWIAKSIESVLDICSEIVILDDGSTDRTIEICSNYDKVVDICHQENLPLDEARDRNSLLKMALNRKPDFILSIDGDEILMPHSKNILFEELDILYPDSNVFEFQVLTFWDKPNQIRYDGIYSNNWQKRMFRLKDQPKDLKISNSIFPGNLHCGSIPNNTIEIDTPTKSNVKIFHYGNFDQNIRQKKYDWYTSIDPNNKLTDEYQHMITSKGRFSGKQGFEFKSVPSKFLTDFT